MMKRGEKAEQNIPILKSIFKQFFSQYVIEKKECFLPSKASFPVILLKKKEFLKLSTCLVYVQDKLT